MRRKSVERNLCLVVDETLLTVYDTLHQQRNGATDMYEYQITIHPNGKFLFRTDWMDGRQDSAAIATQLCEKFGADSVTVTRRSLMRTSATGTEEIEALFAA